MPYLTYKLQKNKNIKQLDLFNAILNNEQIELETDNLNYTRYHTVLTEHVVKTEFNTKQAKTLLSGLRKNISINNTIYKELLEEGLDKHYSTFRIPKASGGFRTIDAPDATLKTILRNFKDFFQTTCQIHPHNAAYAYTPERCAKNALEKHQYNQSMHYLHIDLKDFFTSCTADFIHQQLRKIYPFSELYKTEEGINLITLVIDLSLYKGHLPQGTPLSPYLTNIIMIPIDYALNKLCKQRNKQHLVYTRYADDIDISSKYEFNYEELIKEINLVLAQQSPLQINNKKVHYGTTAGRNWHLGLIINKDNKISIGNKRKRELKSLLLNYCKYKSEWTRADMQQFHGELSYFRSIEPEYHDYLIQQYSEKFNNGYNIITEIRENLK